MHEGIIEKLYQEYTVRGFISEDHIFDVLEENGICASAGSACNTSDRSVSHVIKAIDVPEEYENGTIRFSIGTENTKDEIIKTVKILKENVALLRKG